ncbi:MAG: glycosyl hydrolase family 8, partial [Clostridium sp.]
MFNFKKNFIVFTSTFVTAMITTQTLGGLFGNAAEIEKNITTSQVKYDLNKDGIINNLDLLIVAKDYNFHSNNVNFNINVDFNKDNIIDIYDLTLIASNFNNEIESKYYGIKPNTVTEDELNKIVLKAFDDYMNRYFKTVPGKNQMYIDYILDERLDPSATWVDRQAVTVSEAHGYGMLAITNAANMAPERSKELESTFKSFYNFFRAHPSDFSSDLMCWQMMGVGYNENGTGTLTDVINTPNGPDSATDGDMDIAYALLAADNIWGSSGTINYRAEALKIIKAIYKLEVNKDENILLLGDWVLAKNDAKYKTITRSSDFMVNHLRLFASVDTENKEGWLKVLSKTEEITESNIKNWSKQTGLVADFIYKENGVYVPVKGNVLEGVNDGDYNYNACRAPWRLSMDS